MRRTLLLLALFAVVATACGGGGGSATTTQSTREAEDETTTSRRSRTPMTTAPARDTQPKGPEDTGDFYAFEGEVEDDDLQVLADAFTEAQVAESLAESLNELIALPEDIGIGFTECGTVNAFYDPSDRTITMCYELLLTFQETFQQAYDSEDDANTATQGATLFVFFHELGHALVDVLELPVTGREEDAVDGLSTYILVSGGEETENYALDGARAFLFLSGDAEERMFDETDFADEHSLGPQRFFNIVCWVFGSDPEGNADLAEDEQTLPEDRAVRCPDEWEQLDSSWSRLLEPFLKSE